MDDQRVRVAAIGFLTEHALLLARESPSGLLIRVVLVEVEARRRGGLAFRLRSLLEGHARLHGRAVDGLAGEQVLNGEDLTAWVLAPRGRVEASARSFPSQGPRSTTPRRSRMVRLLPYDGCLYYSARSASQVGLREGEPDYLHWRIECSTSSGER